jgi:hypothetical protein
MIDILCDHIKTNIRNANEMVRVGDDRDSRLADILEHMNNLVDEIKAEINCDEDLYYECQERR